MGNNSLIQKLRICIVAFIFKLSSLVNLIRDSILPGFKAGAALSIMSTQLPKLFGVEEGGKHFFVTQALATRGGNATVPHYLENVQLFKNI